MKIKKTQDQAELLIHELLDPVSPTHLIKHGIPAIIKDGQVIMRSAYGLHVFLEAWVQEEDNNNNNQFLVEKIVDFLKNAETYVEYAGRILKFIHDNDKIPEKDEAWEMDIPIDQMDSVLELINIEIEDEVFGKLSPKEKQYYDELSKTILGSNKKLQQFRLEDLTTDHGLNLIDAKILPIFINNLLGLEDINKEIAQYLDISKLSSKKRSRLNQLATKIIQKGLSGKKSTSLLDLAQKLGASILEVGETLHFLENADKITELDLSDESMKELSKPLIKALKYCQKEKAELSSNLLVKRFGLDLLKSNQVIQLYGQKFTLPANLSRKETTRLDNISRSVIKYIKEVNEEPTIDDLMMDLNLNIKDANLSLVFINRIASEPFEEDFDQYPENKVLEIDDLSCDLLKKESGQQAELNFIDLAYQLGTGVYSVKQAMAYSKWIEEKVDEDFIKNLPDEEKQIIMDKIKSALKYIRENKLSLDFKVLIEDVGFNLKDTHQIIGLYNEIISEQVKLELFSDEKKNRIESLAREIYKAKKQGKISEYEPQDVFTLDLGASGLEELWEALTYLKVKVLEVLMTDSTLIRTEAARLHSEGKIELKERYGTKVGKKERIKLTKETIKTEGTKISFKSGSARVQLRRGMDFVGGMIRYKVVIKNSTDMLITNVEVSLQMTAEHIRIIDIKPKINKKGDRGRIANMSPEQSESIDFYLEPMICGSIPVAPMATYTDAFGNAQMVTKEKLMVVSKCPPIINPGEENIAKVKNIYEGKDMISQFRSFELEHDPSRSFDTLREAIGSWAGKAVSKPVYESKEPFTAEIFYFVLNQNKDPGLGHQEQIIIKVRVDENKNVAMIHIGAEKNTTVNGVLTHVWQLANKHFGERFGYEFESLRCPECGGSLDGMEKELDHVTCKYCGEKFEKKAIK